MERFLLAAMTALLLSVATAWAVPLQEGIDARERGDYTNALRIFRLLAEQENAAAKYNLAMMYGEGQGVAQDAAAAVKWHRMAAEQGHAGAQLMLGAMYVHGQGVVKDYIRAYMWFSLSAASGYTAAINIRDVVAKRMTSQQIAQAQKMTRDCQRRNLQGCV